MLALLASPHVYATSLHAQETPASARIEIDNDYFLFDRPPLERPDHDYTHGTRIAWSMEPPDVIQSSRLCEGASGCQMRMQFGQHLYTPLVEGATPVPGQRPFAGWLFGSLVISPPSRGYRFRDFHLTLGITGPASLAAESQLWLHRMIPAFRRPIGWENQLSSEIAFDIAVSQGWRVPLARRGSFAFIAIPELSVALGTLRSAVGMSARAEAGYNLAAERAESAAGKFSFVAFAEVGGELMLNSLFLNGNTFGRSVRVAPTHELGQWARGVRVRFGQFSIEHSITTQSREYAAAEPTHSYGTIAMMWSWRR